MTRYSISIVDDEETIRDSLTLVLEGEYDVSVFGDAESFLSSLEKAESETSLPDLVLMDIGLPMMSGIDALHILKKQCPSIPVIMITAYEEIQMVIESMKTGAFDFILKPLNPDILEITIQKALSSIALRKEVKQLQEKYLKDHLPCFIGESRNIEEIMDFIQLVAKSPDTPVLITGETGTGKELIAKAIHARSPVFKGPFIAVNCSAFPDELIESELFGYEEGAFSGARKKGKKGLIEEAHKGTLFLDEVADLSLAGQAKLLRFLESAEFYKVGSTKKRTVTARIVSATNKNLEKCIEKKEFRKDLYFRLCVVKADIPSLNDRKDDILPLAKYFLYQFNKKFNKALTDLSEEARHLLLNHCFVGNVRELKNIMERAALIANGPLVKGSDLGLHIHSETDSKLDNYSLSPLDIPPPDIPKDGTDLSRLLETIEHQYLEHAMVLANGNESKAARLLKMNHHTFRYRLKKFK